MTLRKDLFLQIRRRSNEGYDVSNDSSSLEQYPDGDALFIEELNRLFDSYDAQTDSLVNASIDELHTHKRMIYDNLYLTKNTYKKISSELLFLSIFVFGIFLQAFLYGVNRK